MVTPKKWFTTISIECFIRITNQNYGLVYLLGQLGGDSGFETDACDLKLSQIFQDITHLPVNIAPKGETSGPDMS